MGFFRKLSSYLGIRDISKLKFFLPVLLGLSPTLALAANLFDVPSGDVSMKVLGAIFGGLMDSGTGGMNADPLLSGIKYFNGGCLIIGGVLAGYTILAGTLNTAHDGEMLGKKFSSVWIPVRYSIGTALVLPVVGGGYCVMQALVMWLVTQGIGLADGVWGAYMSNPTSAANTNITTVNESALAVAKNAFSASMCYQSYARAIGESSSVLNWISEYKYTMTKTSTGYVYGDSNSSVRRNGCGEVNYPRAQAPSITVVNSTPTTNQGYLGDIGTIFAPMDISSINQAHMAQTDDLVSKMDNLAKTVIATAPAATANGVSGVALTPEQSAQYYQQIVDAANNYTQNIKTAALGLSTGDAYSKIQQSASNQGWILAGAWFTRIVQMNDTINKAVTSTATSDFNNPKVDSVIFGDAKKYMQGTDQVLANVPGSTSVDANQTQDQSDVGAGKTNDAGTSLMKFEGAVTGALAGVNLVELKNDPRHPLIVVNELGNRLFLILKTLLGGILVALIGAGALAWFTGTIGLLQAAIDLIGWFASVPIQLLGGTAMMSAYMIPNLPFIMWIGCIAGWVLLVIEAIIAAPLWAIMHLHPNGDDLTGRGGNGYTLVLSLLLRPVLMIFGMEASIVISSVIGEFINKTFFEVFANVSGDFTGMSALWGLAAGTLIYVIVQFIFVRKCFSLMFQLPDQLMQWIGGGGAGLGQFAEQFSAAADKGAAGGAAAVGAGAGFAAKGAGKLGGAIKDRAMGRVQDFQNQQKNANEALDAEVGKGASLFRDKQPGMGVRPNPKSMNPFRNTFSEMKQSQAQNQIYDNALIGAASADPVNGRNEFESAFAASAADGHPAYGGDAAAAAEGISKSFISESVGGGSRAAFTLGTAQNSQGNFEGKRVRKVMATLSAFDQGIGKERTNAVLDKAVATETTGGALMHEATKLFKQDLKENGSFGATIPKDGINGESQ